MQQISSIVQRSPSSIRSMLYRMGESTHRGRDWSTVYSFAEAAMLPFALFVSAIIRSECWAFSVQPVLPSDCRPAVPFFEPEPGLGD